MLRLGKNVMFRKVKKLIFLMTGLILASPAEAVCPACVVAVGAGLAISRRLGVSDAVSGTWIGALILAMALWTVSLIKKREVYSPALEKGTVLGYYALFIGWLYFSKLLFLPGNTVFGVDRIIFGIAVGSVSFAGGVYFYGSIKRKNGGRAHFPFEKVILPAAFSLLASILIYVTIG